MSIRLLKHLIYDACVTLPCSTRQVSLTDFVLFAWSQAFQGTLMSIRSLKHLIMSVCYTALWHPASVGYWFCTICMVMSLSRHPDEHQVTEAPHYERMTYCRVAPDEHWLLISYHLHGHELSKARMARGKCWEYDVLAACWLKYSFVARWLVIWRCKCFHGVHVLPRMSPVLTIIFMDGTNP